MPPLSSFSPFGGEKRKYGRLDNNQHNLNSNLRHSDEESLFPSNSSTPSPIEMTETGKKGGFTSNSATAVTSSSSMLKDWSCSPKGLKIWKEITNVDRFLEELYLYYEGKGIFVILISKLSDLMIKGFVVFLTFVMIYCVDYSLLLGGSQEKDMINQSFWSIFHLENFSK